MIRRLLAVWRGRNDIVAGRARYPGYLWRHLLKAARRPTDPEPPSQAPTVHLPAVLDPGQRTGPAVDVHPSADRQPTAAPSTTDGGPVTLDGVHEGATEDWSPLAAVAQVGQSTELLTHEERVAAGLDEPTEAEIAEATRAELGVIDELLAEFAARWAAAGLPARDRDTGEFGAVETLAELRELVSVA